MLVIRLARAGRHKYPTYRIVAAESSRAATGKFVEILGHYNPHTKDLVIKKAETEARLQNGAQPSNTVAKLLQKEKIELPKWVELKTKNKAPKKEPVAEEPKAAAPVAEEPAAEAPAEEPKAEAEEKVAEAATENEAKREEEAPLEADPAVTETAETTEEAAEAAEAVQDAGTEEPTEDKPAE